MTKISEETKIPRASAALAIQVLIESGIITKDSDGRYGLNKNYNEWINQAVGLLPLSNGLDRVSNQLDGVVSNTLDKSVQPIGQSYKELKKDLKKDICASRFIPPTLQEVKAYFLEKNTTIDPEKFYAHYESVNWFKGKSKIKNWKACLTTWERSDFQSKPKKKDPDLVSMNDFLAAQDHL